MACSTHSIERGERTDDDAAHVHRWKLSRAELLEAFREYHRTGDQRLRNELVELHLDLARREAMRFAGRGEPVDDLLQVARLGMLKAVERFDPTIGVPFSAFARPTIAGELRRHFRDTTWSVHVPRGLKDLHAGLGRTTAALAASLGRQPTAAELAKRARRQRRRGTRGARAALGVPADVDQRPDRRRRIDDRPGGGRRVRRHRSGDRLDARPRTARSPRRTPANDRLPALLRPTQPVGDRRASGHQPGSCVTIAAIEHDHPPRPARRPRRSRSDWTTGGDMSESDLPANSGQQPAPCRSRSNVATSARRDSQRRDRPRDECAS